MPRCLAALLVIALVLGGPAYAQDRATVRVQASAEPTTVGAEGRVTYTLRVDGASRAAVETPSPPSTSNLELQQTTPTTQQSLSFEDGQPQRSVTFEWTYRPLRTGPARIEPATVQVRGERYTTGEVRVEVVPESEARAAQADDSSADERREISGEEKPLASQPLFIRGESSSEAVYENEQVTMEYRLYFRPGVRLRRSRMAEAWEAPGFWREELDVPSRPVPKTTTVDGQTYERIVLKRVALFPTRAGPLRVDPLRIETEAQGTGRGFRGQYESLTLASDTLSVDVRALPSGAPPAFDGAVGRFAMTARRPADSVAVGEGAELAVRVSGPGNLPTIAAPTLEAPSAVDVYGPEVETDLDRSGDEIRGTKTFTYTLVPGAAGRHVVPPVQLTYFDPATRRYETARTDSIVLRASGSAEAVATSRTGAGLPVGDIAGLMTSPGQWTRVDAPPLYRQWAAYAVLLVPIVLGLGGVAYRRRGAVREDEEGDAEPTDDPLSDVQLHLRKAEEHAGDPRAFYGAVERAVRAFLAARLDGLPGQDGARLEERLSRHAVPPADRDALRDLLDTCERVQFAPDTPDKRPTDVLKHTQALLRRLDNALPSA